MFRQRFNFINVSNIESSNTRFSFRGEYENYFFCIINDFESYDIGKIYLHHELYIVRLRHA